jgi:hypothetical protein
MPRFCLETRSHLTRALTMLYAGTVSTTIQSTQGSEKDSWRYQADITLSHSGILFLVRALTFIIACITQSYIHSKCPIGEVCSHHWFCRIHIPLSLAIDHCIDDIAILTMHLNASYGERFLPAPEVIQLTLSKV